MLEVHMIAIKPVSDLRNYNEVLQDVADESPVFLTKNGRGSTCPYGKCDLKGVLFE